MSLGDLGATAAISGRSTGTRWKDATPALGERVGTWESAEAAGAAQVGADLVAGSDATVGGEAEGAGAGGLAALAPEHPTTRQRQAATLRMLHR